MAIILHFCDLLIYVQLKSIFKWKETNYVTGWTTHFLTTLGATWIYLSWITHFNITYSDHAHVLVGICTCESLGDPIFLGSTPGALGSAIIAHWTFSIQEKGLLSNTTLLERPWDATEMTTMCLCWISGVNIQVVFLLSEPKTLEVTFLNRGWN